MARSCVPDSEESSDRGQSEAIGVPTSKVKKASKGNQIFSPPNANTVVDGWTQVNTAYDRNALLLEPLPKEALSNRKSFQGCAFLVFKSVEHGIAGIGHSCFSTTYYSWKGGCVAVTCSWNKGNLTCTTDRGPSYLSINIDIPKLNHGFGGLKECEQAECECGFCDRHRMELRFYTNTFKLEHRVLDFRKDGATKKDALRFYDRIPSGASLAIRLTTRVVKRPLVKGYPFPYLPGSGEAVDMKWKMHDLIEAGQWTLYYPMHESHGGVFAGIGRMFAEKRYGAYPNGLDMASCREAQLPTLHSIFAALARKFNQCTTMFQLLDFLSDEDITTVLMRQKIEDFDMYSFFLKLHNAAHDGKPQDYVVDAVVSELYLKVPELAKVASMIDWSSGNSKSRTSSSGTSSSGKRKRVSFSNVRQVLGGKENETEVREEKG